MEQRLSTSIRSSSETSTPRSRSQRTGGAAPFPSVQTFETTLGVRRNFARAQRRCLREKLAQFRGRRRMKPGKLVLGARWRRRRNSWLPNFAGNRWAGVSSPHLQRNVWPPPVQNPLLPPIFARTNAIFATFLTMVKKLTNQLAALWVSQIAQKMLRARSKELNIWPPPPKRQMDPRNKSQLFCQLKAWFVGQLPQGKLGPQW